MVDVPKPEYCALQNAPSCRDWPGCYCGQMWKRMYMRWTGNPPPLPDWVKRPSEQRNESHNG